MTDRFVDSGASGSATGADWTNAYAKLADAVSASSAGDTIYVADTHSESTAASVSYAFPTDPSSPLKILCVTASGASGNSGLSTGAAITTTGITSISLSSGFAYIYGIAFNSSTTTSGSVDINIGSASAHGIVCENCTFAIRSGSVSSTLNLGNVPSSSDKDGRITFADCTMSFAATGQNIIIGNSLIEMINLTLSGATALTTLFAAISSGCGGNVLLRDSDLTGFAWSNIANVAAAAPIVVDVRNCKMPSGWNMVTGTHPGPGGPRTRAHNCADTSGRNYAFREEYYAGSIREETTIVRSGGASDGTTALSWKMAASAGASLVFPLSSPEIVAWVDGTGSKTFTVEIVNDGVTLKDDEVWLEVEYLGTASFPKGSVASDRKADILAAGTDQAASTETWVTTPLAAPVKQKLEVTATVNLKGAWRARVMLAKAGQTIYADPKVAVS